MGEAGGAAAAAVFDGLIQNAKGRYDGSEVIPLFIQSTKTKEEFICDASLVLFEGKVNNKTSGLGASQAAYQAVQEAEMLYNALKQRRYIN